MEIIGVVEMIAVEEVELLVVVWEIVGRAGSVSDKLKFLLVFAIVQKYVIRLSFKSSGLHCFRSPPGPNLFCALGKYNSQAGYC